jgi:hypothetical protein
MRDHRRHERLGQIVEIRPKQRHVKRAAGEIQRLVEKSFDVPDGIAVLVRAVLPVFRAGVVNQIGKKDAMAQAGEVVDIGRGRIRYR